MFEHLRFKDLEGFPLTNLTSVAVAISTYLIVVFSLKQWMTNRNPFKLTGIVAAHNFFLSGLSLLILGGMIATLTSIFQNTPNAVRQFFCDDDSKISNGPQVIFFYIFYLSKFYELLDTVIIVLKKRPIIFLHVYHHCITVLLVYVMIKEEVAVTWLSTVANVSVHIPMYYYYAISALRHSVWWKKYITVMQITQFVVDLSANSVGFVYFYQGVECSGSLWSWIFGQGVLLSFLLLFISFYKTAYKTDGAIKKDSREAIKSNGHGGNGLRKPRKDD